MSVWWGTPLECLSALSRREREGMPYADVQEAIARLDALAAAWAEVEPATRLREVAARLIRTHSLRAADALQLGAAIIAAEERPATLDLVTLDERLADAASREGFRVEALGA
jgi:predicted nucleic acid-binding protein